MDIRHRTQLDAKRTLEPRRFLQRFVVIARDDRVHSNRKPIRTNYEGPIRVEVGGWWGEPSLQVGFFCVRRTRV
jgi:hypothetical protein